MLTLPIGGARSGNSSFAESLCSQERRVAYAATAQVQDKEIAERVRRHHQDRPAHWITIEEPLNVEAAVRHGCNVVLLDCLTVWLGNLLYHHRRRTSSAIELIALLRMDAIAEAASTGSVVVVSNEVGAGIVPTTKIARLLRDLQGRANQCMAAAADQVQFLAAGIPVQINPGCFV